MFSSAISEVSEIENSSNKNKGIIIYYPKAGDTLWKIAKKFKSTVRDIAAVNDITDVDKIMVGQQLYIPI